MKRVALTNVLVAALIAALPAFAPLASATTMFPKKFTCPIGGEKFKDYVIGSSTSWGQRPDGRTYGTLPVYPLVECPGNGFLLYQDEFTPEEIARLTPLVASDEFQAMRKSETSYHRLWWLLQAMGRPSADLANALLVASWETDDDRARKARYQRAFVDAAAAIPPDDEAWFYYNLRAANALRELERFDGATMLLDAVKASPHWPSDKGESDGARFLANGLAALIAEHNPVSEPTNLIPPQMAVERCRNENAALSPSEKTACDTPEYQDALSDADTAEDSAQAAAIDAGDAVEAANRGD